MTQSFEVINKDNLDVGQTPFEKNGCTRSTKWNKTSQPGIEIASLHLVVTP